MKRLFLKKYKSVNTKTSNMFAFLVAQPSLIFLKRKNLNLITKKFEKIYKKVNLKTCNNSSQGCFWEDI